MNSKSTALLVAILLWTSAGSGFADVSPRPHGGDPLNRGVETLSLHAGRAGLWLRRRAQKWNRAITPVCFMLAIGIAAWRIVRGLPNGETAAHFTLHLLLSLLLFFRAPEIFFHPYTGLLPHTARLAGLRLARLSPEGAQGTNVRQWWKSWLRGQENPAGCKLSPTYARERVLGFPEGGSTAHRFLIDQARRTLVSTLRQDVLPGERLENAFHALLLLSERKFLRALLVLCLILLGIGFSLLSLLQLLFCGGSTFLWELTMATALVALPLVLLGPPPRYLRAWLQLFLLASLSSILWQLFAAVSYLGLTTLFASVFGERGLFGELRGTGGEMLKDLISKRSLLLSFWSLTPELPRTILLGLYEMMAGLIGFCTVAAAVCSLLFLGAVLPLVGVCWALGRQRQVVDSLAAGWSDLHREIAFAATALGNCLAAWASRLDNEEPTPAVHADAPVAGLSTDCSDPSSSASPHGNASSGAGGKESLS